MDEAIVNYVRRKHHVLIGENSAERIKIEAGSAISRVNGAQIEVHVKGRDLRRGMPTQISLGPSDIADALALPIDQIADGIQRVLEELPPELSSDISNRGIVLTGGGALLNKIDVELKSKLGVECRIPEDPMNCAVLGTGMALEQRDELKDLLMEPY
jgi:rod shape-determining protein MreB